MLYYVDFDCFFGPVAAVSDGEALVGHTGLMRNFANFTGKLTVGHGLAVRYLAK